MSYFRLNIRLFSTAHHHSLISIFWVCDAAIQVRRLIYKISFCFQFIFISSMTSRNHIQVVIYKTSLNIGLTWQKSSLCGGTAVWYPCVRACSELNEQCGRDYQLKVGGIKHQEQGEMYGYFIPLQLKGQTISF